MDGRERFRTRLAARAGGRRRRLLAWLWPIGIGGKMPVGGDVTQFFLGLMGFLSESLRDGRLPVWNDLWGYGFPGPGREPDGGVLPAAPDPLRSHGSNTETAYVVSLVLHTLWGGLGAFWAARRMGISGVGVGAGGVLLVDVRVLPDPPGASLGLHDRMLDALGVGPGLVDASRRRARSAPAAPFLLSLVLVLQVLPGHFQLAFLTQVGARSDGRLGGRRALGGRPAARGGAADAVEGAGPALRRAGAWSLAVAAVFPLAAIQLWPTARLAGLAGGQRDFEYLSGFASTPFHLVNYVAPGLFHRSPLWRPLVWDPFHTCPRSIWPTSGWFRCSWPCMAMVRELRRDAGRPAADDPGAGHACS